MLTKIAHEGKTCTVIESPGTRCGMPAVLGFRSSMSGHEAFECARHEQPLPAASAPAKAAKAKAQRCERCNHFHTFGPCAARVGAGEACGCTHF